MKIADISLKDYISADKGLDEIERAKAIYEKEGETGGSMLSADFLNEICKKYGLEGDKKERLFNALSCLEEREDLSCFFKFLVLDLCRDRK